MDYSKFGGDASDDDGLYNSSFQLNHLFSHHEFDRFLWTSKLAIYSVIVSIIVARPVKPSANCIIFMAYV